MRTVLLALVLVATLASGGWARSVSLVIGGGLPDIEYVHADKTPRLSIDAVNVTDLTLTVHKLSGLPEHQSMVDRLAPVVATRTMHLGELPKKDFLDFSYNKSVPLPIDREGVYLCQVDDGHGHRAEHVLCVTRLLLTVKLAPQELLVYAYDEKSGVGASGCDITVFDTTVKSHPSVLQGETGKDGVLRLRIPNQSGSYRIVGKKGDSYSAVSGEHASPKPDHLYVYTDRPLYRPGQTVSFKALWRRRPYGSTEYENVADQPVMLLIRDSVGSLIFRQAARTSAFGTVNGQYQLSPEPPLGSYSVEVLGSGETMYGSFRVEEYRKPEFSVTVQPGKPFFMTGENLDFAISGRYLFGTPVAGGKYTYKVYSTAFTPPAPAEVAPEDAYLISTPNNDGRVVPAEQGEFVVQGEGTLDASGVAHVRLPARQGTTATTLQVDAQVTDDANRTQSGTDAVLVAANSYALTAASDLGVYKPGEPVRVDVVARDWNGKPRAVPITVSMGRMHDTVFAVAAQVKARTGAEGKVRVTLPAPEAEGYSVRVEGEDGSRPPVQTEFSIQVAATKLVGNDRFPELEMLSDRPVYSPGEQALVLFRTREVSGHVLLVCEGDRIFEYHLVPIHDHLGHISLKVTNAESPTLHLSADLVHFGGTWSAESPVAVRPHSHLLKLGLAVDKTEARPGDTETVTLTTTDMSGKPVPAEVSLAAVDEAIFLLAPELAMPIQQFFWGYREDGIVTLRSPAPMYSAGSFQKVGTDVKIRKKFLDTAEWAPALLTGDNGKLTLKFEFPDNLTSWRLTATGISKATQVGSAKATTVVRKPFMIRVIVPRFLTRGDHTTILTQVINETGAEQSVTVKLKVENLKLDGTDTWTGSMKAGEIKSIKWPAFHDNTLPPRVTATAVAGSGVSDGEEQSMSAIPWGSPTTSTAAGWLPAASTVEIPLQLPSQFDQTAGGFQVRLSPGIPGLVAATLGTLQSGGSNTDDISNTVLMDGMVVDAVKHHQVVLALSGGRLSRTVQQNVPTLYARQHNDGGWPWVVGDNSPSDPYVSAQVVQALATARRAGFLIDDDKLNKGVEYLLRDMNVKENLGLATSLAAAISEVKPIEPDTLAYMYEHREQLDYYGQASLAMVLLNSKQNAKVKTVVANLVKAVTRTADQAHWETAPEKYDWSDDAVLATARVMQAVATSDADNPVLEPTLRWLVMRRGTNGWDTARANVAASAALLQWMMGHHEQGGPLDVELLVNDQKVGHWTVETGDPHGKELSGSVRPNQLHGGANTVKLRATGKGSALYSWQLQTYPMSMDPEPARDEGLAVNRQYFRRIFNYDAKGKLTYRFEPLHGSVKVGDQVLVVVKFASWHSTKYLKLEDPLPAGFDASEEDETSLYPTDYQKDYVDRMYFRDQRVEIYQDHAEPRIYLYTYMMRATTPGRYGIDPATVRLAYYPEVRGNSTAGLLEVTP